MTASIHEKTGINMTQKFETPQKWIKVQVHTTPAAYFHDRNP